jgi:hypothetical protein
MEHETRFELAFPSRSATSHTGQIADKRIVGDPPLAAPLFNVAATLRTSPINACFVSAYVASRGYGTKPTADAVTTIAPPRSVIRGSAARRPKATPSIA